VAFLRRRTGGPHDAIEQRAIANPQRADSQQLPLPAGSFGDAGVETIGPRLGVREQHTLWLVDQYRRHGARCARRSSARALACMPLSHEPDLLVDHPIERSQKIRQLRRVGLEHQQRLHDRLDGAQAFDRRLTAYAVAAR
jgi:hypothetical protein